jgi:NitT/TauT family transport system substrate-binding protein
LKTPKDLEGKTVIYTAASVEGPYMDSFFAAGGADRSKVNLVSVDLAAKMSTYASGTGDAVVTTIPYGAPLVKPRTSETIEFADYGFVLPGYGMYVHEDTLKAKLEAIRKVVGVMRQVWTEMSTDSGAEECADIFIKQRPDAKLLRDQLIEQIKLQIPYFYTEATKGKPIGWQAEEDWRDTIKTLERAKLIPAGTKPSDYFTNELIK